MTSVRRSLPAVALAALLTLALAGCSTTVVDNDRLEAEIVTLYEDDAEGSTVESVDCPEDVEIAAGESFTCAFTTATGAEGEVTVTMTDDEGDLDLEVTRFPDDIGSAVIERDIAEDFSAQSITDPVAEVTCPDPLDLSGGSDCTIETESGEVYIATVTQDESGELGWEYFETE